MAYHCCNYCVDSGVTMRVQWNIGSIIFMSSIWGQETCLHLDIEVFSSYQGSKMCFSFFFFFPPWAAANLIEGSRYSGSAGSSNGQVSCNTGFRGDEHSDIYESMVNGTRAWQVSFRQKLPRCWVLLKIVKWMLNWSFYFWKRPFENETGLSSV